jgi:hypothetical protein
MKQKGTINEPMKIRVGAVGPKDSVNLIGDIAKEFSDHMVIVPFTYNSVEETAEIIQKGKLQVDVWLFSGQAPYAIAKEHQITQKAFFPPLNGSSLTKILLEISYKDRRMLERLSFDTIPGKDINETFAELGLPYEGLHLYSYSGYKPTNELVSFHSSLFQNHMVDACVTCLHSVHQELKRLGIPVYRISPTRMIIRQTLNLARQQGETLHFKKSQIAVQFVQIGEMEKLIVENRVSYDVHRLNLQLQEAILDYTEAISGSFVSLGNGKYIIFSTRGSIEDQNGYHPSVLLEKISLITNLTTNIGIGYGETSLAAEQNAQLALIHARNYGGFCCFLVDHSGSIKGPLQQPDSIVFDYRTDNKELSDKLKKAGVTITTFNKLLSVQKNISQNSITSANISEWLKMTQRNANRILNDLEQQGLAVIIGEESPVSRGRPRKIFRVGEDI